jgi:glyoxylase-like metal-dependent hydrolase (beta-lactamase superfamily II)
MTQLHQVASNLYVTESRLDDFDVRGVVVIGSERTVVWDTLSHPSDMRPLLPLLRDRKASVVYSHADWDHIWGTAAIPYHEVIAHRLCQERFSTDVPRCLADKRLQEPEKWDEVVLIPPTATFDTQMSLDLGGVTLELHHLPGHTRDCCVGFIPEWGLLLAGDVVETPLPVVEEDSPLQLWVAALERWEAETRIKTVIPAHGPIGDRSLLTRNISYLRGLSDGSATTSLPTEMSPFYVSTHAQNLRYARKG